MRETASVTVVIPCSGIRTPLGAVSREAAHELCVNLCPTTTRLVAISDLILGEDEAARLVCRCPVVTIDGCESMCATSLVQRRKGDIVRTVAVLDVCRRHQHPVPEGIAELSDDDRELAHFLAEGIAADLDVMELSCRPY